MIAEIALLNVIQRGLQQLDFLRRLFCDHALQAIRQLGVLPVLLDSLTLQPHAPVDIVHLAVRALFNGNKILRHRCKPDRRHVVAILDQHDGGADRQIQQKLAHRQIKVGLAQDRKHLLRIDVERGLCLNGAILRDVRARL